MTHIITAHARARATVMAALSRRIAGPPDRGDVPPTPASHGCCRVSLPAIDFLWGAGGMKVGTRVLVR